MASGSAPARTPSPASLNDLKAARDKVAAAKLLSESKAAKQAAGRPIEDVWAAQLRQVVAEIEREVQDKADRQREGVSRVELLSVQLENDCVMESVSLARSPSLPLCLSLCLTHTHTLSLSLSGRRKSSGGWPCAARWSTSSTQRW